MLGNEVPGRGTYLPLKSNEIKYFYELIKEERREKSLKIMMKYLKIMIQYKSKENMDHHRLFYRYCDLNLTSWGSLFFFFFFSIRGMGFTLNFGAAISYQSLFSVVVFKIFPWLYASNNTPYVRIYYCTTSLCNHRLFLIPHFELWNLSSTLASSAAACCLAVSDLSYAWN